MKYHCECEQCKNNEFNPEDYIIKKDDFKILDKERPLGISGHLRVKDEAMSIAECIDSCIEALDELIITYNKSSDNTEEILKEYEKKYPDKIRLYFYEPNIIKYNKDEYKTKYSELHYFYYYSNFGYLKIRYKYYFKIDADQIYFTEKILKIREALLADIELSSDIRKLLMIEKIAWYIPIKKLRNNLKKHLIKKKIIIMMV
ncbi:glycosyltransferase [uncultured Brachyspira sp.]|uniref:glycosyltransferase n=1 Tax=uncultured Brachyspira sp. TaxID=221953 RepID=UPI00262E6C50|nr:glycosyltransferase [uncultured Brachyspira sp.]